MTFARVLSQNRGDDRDQSCLSAARRPDDHKKLTALDLKIKTTQSRDFGLPVAIAFCYAPAMDCQLTWWRQTHLQIQTVSIVRPLDQPQRVPNFSSRQSLHLSRLLPRPRLPAKRTHRGRSQKGGSDP